ncbi:MAG: sulfotransferase family 2 domain-containing protein [Panacagrimonas sp.]
MILSNRYNFLYVHIAKTGGTSVRAALKSLQWRDPYYLAQWTCSRLSGLTGHRIAAKLPRHSKIIGAQEMLPQEFFDRLYKFAFVRNPWDLQVSSYHHLKRERPLLLEGHESFEAFTRWKLESGRPYQYHLDTSITPLTDYLIDLRGKLLTDYVGRYERLHEDWDHICKRLGIVTPELPHKRKATDRSKDYRSYYSDDLAELVGNYFRRDVEMLGYRFDPD